MDRGHKGIKGRQITCTGYEKNVSMNEDLKSSMLLSSLTNESHLDTEQNTAEYKQWT